MAWAVALAMPGMGAAGGETEKVNTTVKSIKYGYSDLVDVRIYSVRMKSPKNKCLDKRKVTVIEKIPGPDRIVGTDQSQDGNATVTEQPAPPFENGERFYARVAKRTVGDTVCRRTVSDVFPVQLND